MKKKSTVTHISELKPYLKELEYTLQENEDSFTISSRFSFRSSSLREAYVLIGISLFTLIISLFRAKDTEDLILGLVTSLVFLGVGIVIIWVEKHHYFTLATKEIRYREQFREKAIRLYSGLRVKLIIDTFTKRGKGGVRTFQNMEIVVGSGKEKATVFSIGTKISDSHNAEEFAKGLVNIIKHRVETV